MKPIEQTIARPPKGDCFRACIASILELPIEATPNPPSDPDGHWWNDWTAWLVPHGYELVQWEVAPASEQRVCAAMRGYWIATVPSLNAPPPPPDRPNLGRHAIVMRGDEIAHDPSTGEKWTAEKWEAKGGQIFEVTLVHPLDPAASLSTSSDTGGAGVQHEPWTGVANIAWCPEHGLHGARDTCFACGKPVKQIPMIPVAELKQNGEAAEELSARQQVDAILNMAALASAPEELWDGERTREEAAWLRGRDDTVAHLRGDLADLPDSLSHRSPQQPVPDTGGATGETDSIPVTDDDRDRLREIARLIEIDSRRDDAQRDARFLHRFAERGQPDPAGEVPGREGLAVKRLSADEIESVAADAARKAAPVFVANGWEWSDDDRLEVPSEDRIRDTIKRLARDAQARITDGGGWICTGRFYVAVDVEDGQEVCTVLLMLTINDGELLASTQPKPANPSSTTRGGD